MNNNTSSVNSNNTTSSSSPSSKNVPKKINGTTDNSNFRSTTDQSAIVNTSTISELPCNICHRSSEVNSTSQNHQQNSVGGAGSRPPNNLFHNCANANNFVVDGNHQQSANQANPVPVPVPPHLSTDEDDDDDCTAADSDDQYCVYTYKGDGSSQQPLRLAADLPSSFFKLHPSDNSSCPPSTSSSEIPSLEPTTSSSSRCCHSSSSSVVQNGSIHNPPAVDMNVNPNNNAMYSPDMDFLEMDFDPGGSGDGCCDGDDEDEEEDVVRDHLCHGGEASSGGGNLPGRHVVGSVPVAGPSGCSSSARGSNNQVLNDDHASAAVVLSKLVVTRTNGGGGCISSSEFRVRNTANEPVAHCSKHFNNLNSSSSVGQNCVTDSPLLRNVGRSDEIKLRLVKSLTLPEMSSSSGDTGTRGCYSAVSCSGNASNRAMAMSISAPVMDGPCPTVIPAGKSSEDSMELEVEGVMLWTVQEAREVSMSQIGPSACGATACLNVLSALGCIMTTLSPEFVSNCVGTRLRAEEADLPEYLLSRFNAGTTHEDLIAGINRASNGLIYGRFFRIRPNTTPSTLNKWLLHWICKGAVPIATLNLQVRRPGEQCSEIPDAWHHQMIFGVTRQGIYLTNPLECVPTAELIPQLSSPSVLLVRRDDVTKRMGPRTDLRKLVRFPDTRWKEMNVLGQVSNMLLEEIPVVNGTGLARRIRTSHISIPAAYAAGITLFVRESNSSSCTLLKAAEEL